MTATTTYNLRRVLGVGFGLAIAFGGTVGVGILRLPSTLAANLGDAKLIVLFWILGGIYALLGAVSVAELAAMIPEAGGFYVYARRAFGKGVGFVVGFADWLNEVSALSYAALSAGTFVGELAPSAAGHDKIVALIFLALFTALHWIGIRLSGVLTRLISLCVGLMMIVIIVGCFLVTPLSAPAVSAPIATGGLFIAVVASLRAVFVAYDGWYSPIYMAEESTSPARTLPRAIIGGTLLVAAVYILLNVAILRVLPIPVLAASTLPAADAARVIMPQGGGLLVTVISLCTLLSLMNAILLMTPRIMVALGRDGLLSERAARVSAGGVPRFALAATSIFSAGLIAWGSFDEIVDIAAVLFLLVYAAAYVSLLVLRRREPDAVRPYRAWGFPVSTIVVLGGCLSLWVSSIYKDPKTGLLAALLLAACVPVYAILKRRRTPPAAGV
ncbi:MAG TPA: APC family permease [Steroidobacteraceae bacterium]|jgi:APA family basic amino acid/polyamine antiporter